jgi:hypothetical protein
MALLVVLALMVALPGAAAAGSSPEVKLRVAVFDGRGASATATLRCADQATATGFLRRAAERHCRRARKLARLLTKPPSTDRVCTQIYGGPRTAHVTGRIGRSRVDRRFARTDGCEIADWDRMGSLLG